MSSSSSATPLSSDNHNNNQLPFGMFEPIRTPTGTQARTNFIYTSDTANTNFPSLFSTPFDHVQNLLHPNSQHFNFNNATQSNNNIIKNTNIVTTTTTTTTSDSNESSSYGSSPNENNSFFSSDNNNNNTNTNSGYLLDCIVPDSCLRPPPSSATKIQENNDHHNMMTTFYGANAMDSEKFSFNSGFLDEEKYISTWENSSDLSAVMVNNSIGNMEQMLDVGNCYYPSMENAVFDNNINNDQLMMMPTETPTSTFGDVEFGHTTLF
ncbi:hypothetical protein K7X08_010345 [Anisodus acutangulus]|uniref:Uncharacterized protein n=1 Tax=Anisodus acutangulus TaxID=402998 RepID=A0A9Q1N709_9SOLA|nr:hypothetical protein K7X08_010345 [Anisodus acutangulus]